MNFIYNIKYFYQDEIKTRFLNIKWAFQDLKDSKFQYSLFESIFHLQWFYKDWWVFLLEKPRSFRNFYCRMRGHAGVAWYNSSGLEPDMSCNFCDDNLG